jgi:exodeoxyribonuclease VII large subunit
VPELEPRLLRLATLRRQIGRAMAARLSEDARCIQTLRARLSDPRFVIAVRQQELDELLLRAERNLRGRLAEKVARHKRLESRLLARHPRLVVLGSRSALVPLEARLLAALRDRLRRARGRRDELSPALGRGMRARLQSAAGRLKSHHERLEGLSPLTVLGRGYSIVTTAEGRVVRKSGEVTAGDRLRVRLHEGTLLADVQERDPQTPPPASGGASEA